MNFAGHVLDMINRVRYNESLKTGYKELYRRIKDAQTNPKNYKLSIKGKKISKEKLEKIKENIRKEIFAEKRKERIKSIILLIILGLFIIAGLIFQRMLNPTN